MKEPGKRATKKTRKKPYNNIAPKPDSETASETALTPGNETDVIPDNETAPTNQNGQNKRSNLLKIKCPECPKELVKGALKRHISEMHSDDIATFPCSLCKFVTKRETQLNKHIRAMHLEPMRKGRPTKRDTKRSRSPFRIAEFNKRHSKAIEMFDEVNDLNTWKDKFQMEIGQLSAKLESKDKEIESLKQGNVQKDVELQKLKIRMEILEQKLKNSNRPDLEDIDGLLVFLNLNKTATWNEIRQAIKYRIFEYDPESPVNSQSAKNMSKEEREEMIIYLNQMQCVLKEWKTMENKSECNKK